MQGFDEFGGSIEVRKVRTVADFCSPGFTLKVDGVVLAPSDRFPTGGTYEVVQVTEVRAEAEATAEAVADAVATD